MENLPYVDSNVTEFSSASRNGKPLTILDLAPPPEGYRPINEKDVSSITDAISFFFVALEMPPELRAFADAIIGAAKGEAGDFICPDIELGKRMWPKDYGEDEEKSLTRKVAYWRTKLMDWQTSRGLTLFSYLEGGRIGEKSYPTQWRCLILSQIADIMNEASREADFRRTPGAALKRVAESVAKIERLRLLSPPKRQRRPTRNVGTAGRLLCLKGTVAGCIKNGATDAEILEALSQGGLTEDRILRALRIAEIPQVIDSITQVPGTKFGTREPVSDPSEPPKSTDFPGTKFGSRGPGANEIRTQFGTSPKEEEGTKLGTVSETDRESQSRSLPSCDSPLEEVDFDEGDLPDLPPFEDYHPDLDHYEGLPEANFFDPEAEALEALEAFASVGAADPLEVTTLNDSSKEVRSWRPRPGATREKLGGWIEEATETEDSFIHRMMGTGEGRFRPLIQIDDCDRTALEKLDGLGFAEVETSPGNWQVWIALPEGTSEAERDYIWDGIIRALNPEGRPDGPNKGGAGSMRWPGSKNFKPERDRWPIINRRIRLGRRSSLEELKRRGLFVAPPPPQTRVTPAAGASVGRCGELRLPVLPYERTLAYFEDEAGSPDRSRADSAWTGTVVRLNPGVSEEALAEALLTVSEKAREARMRGDSGERDYARRTARRAITYARRGLN